MMIGIAKAIIPALLKYIPWEQLGAMLANWIVRMIQGEPDDAKRQVLYARLKRYLTCSAKQTAVLAAALEDDTITPIEARQIMDAAALVTEAWADHTATPEGTALADVIGK
jgi:hypothetical protein